MRYVDLMTIKLFYLIEFINLFKDGGENKGIS